MTNILNVNGGTITPTVLGTEILYFAQQGTDAIGTVNQIASFVNGSVHNQNITPPGFSGYPGQSLGAWLSYPRNVLGFGAIGNGSSNPASTAYATLAALQAVYGTTISGVTVALTQELDWLAHQAAINAATATGGTVYSPGRVYVMSNANSATDGSGQLTFPSCALGNAAQFAVNWKGDFQSTILKWPSSITSGQSAVLCSGRASGSSAGFFEDLFLVGPGIGATLGVSATTMSGIATNDRRNLSRINVNGFYAGIDCVGGQCHWANIALTANNYGVYFNTPNSGNFGNMLWNRVVVNSCNKAAIGVHHAAVIPNCIFKACFFGTSPYSLFKETNSGAPTQAQIAYGCLFDLCQFENFGNAFVCDDIATQAGRVAIIYGCTFRNCQWLWSATYKIPAVSAFSVFDVGGIFQNVIDGISQPEQLTPGTNGIFFANAVSGFKMTGYIDQVIVNCGSSPMCVGAWYQTTDITFENIGYTSWKGELAYTDFTMTVGQFACHRPTWSYNVMQASAGNTSDAKLGVVMFMPGVSQFGIIAVSGAVVVDCSGTVTTGEFLRTAASGNVIAATGSSDETSPIVGIAVVASAAGQCTIKLQGL